MRFPADSYVVLLSFESGAWKIADFGLTEEGISRRAYTTDLSRGTQSYRAPELCRESNAVVNMKSDVWAVGCILFELVSGEKAFSNDIAVARYSDHKQRPEIHLLQKPRECRLQSFITQLIHTMLEVDWWRRPAARDILYGLTCVSNKNTDLFAFRDISRRTFERVLITPDSDKWTTLQWRPQW